MDSIDKAIRLLYLYHPRPGQREALHYLLVLLFKSQDLILIAKTYFGKSMILQAMSILRRKSLTVVVIPLDQIGAEQATVIKRIGGEPLI
jgi:hypothetical protein